MPTCSSAYSPFPGRHFLIYGAIIARAKGCGKFPTSGTLSGTLSSHSSSCLERVAPSSEYHDPAWVHSLLTMKGTRECGQGSADGEDSE